MNRRGFIKALSGAALVTAAGVIIPPAVAAQPDLGFDFTGGSRTLNLYRPESNEHLQLEYLRNGVWATDAYTRICWHLRDVQAQQHVRIDTNLVAILDWTQRYLASLGYREPLHILSGYRTSSTNRRTEGASPNSQHLYGRAVDFAVPGVSPEYLGKLMIWLAQGGVGTYQRKSSVHVDTGPKRTWRR